MCVNISICVCANISMRVCVNISMCVCVCKYTNVCVCVCVNTSTHGLEERVTSLLQKRWQTRNRALFVQKSKTALCVQKSKRALLVQKSPICVCKHINTQPQRKSHVSFAKEIAKEPKRLPKSKRALFV